LNYDEKSKTGANQKTRPNKQKSTLHIEKTIRPPAIFLFLYRTSKITYFAESDRTLPAPTAIEKGIEKAGWKLRLLYFHPRRRIDKAKKEASTSENQVRFSPSPDSPFYC